MFHTTPACVIDIMTALSKGQLKIYIQIYKMQDSSEFLQGDLYGVFGVKISKDKKKKKKETKFTDHTVDTDW